MSRRELLAFEKYQQLESEGAFVDERIQYLLSALCQLSLLYLSAKGGDAEELRLHFGEPTAVQMRKPTADDWKKMDEKKEERVRKGYEGFLALAQSKGVEVKEVTLTRQRYFKEFEDVL